MKKMTGRARGINRVIEILEHLREGQKPLTVGQLAKQMGAPRSSLYEIVNRLSDAGILETIDERGRIFFGRAVYLYADAYLSSQPLVRNGRDEVNRLAEITGETAQLCMLIGNKHTVTHMQLGSNLFRLSTQTGVLFPIPWTASGRLLLGRMTDEEIRNLIPPEDYRLPNGDEISFEDFLKDVRKSNIQGYSVTSLADRFTMCLAAPILDNKNVPVATICFVIPVQSDKGKQKQLLKILVESGQVISRRMSANGNVASDVAMKELL